MSVTMGSWRGLLINLAVQVTYKIAENMVNLHTHHEKINYTFEWGPIQTCMLYMKKTHTFECLFLFATNIAIFGYNDQGRSKKLDENSILSPCSAALEIHTGGLRHDLCVFMYFRPYLEFMVLLSVVH